MAQACTRFTVVSGTTITTFVPASATTGPIRVTAPGGTATSATNFAVCPAPQAITQNATVGLNASGNAAATATTVNNDRTVNCGVAPTTTRNSAASTARATPTGALVRCPTR